MEENNTVDPEMKASNSVDHLKPIKDTIETVGIEMPDLVAEGSLSVENKDDKEKPKKVNKKDIPLPVIGKIFMLDGHEYRVTFINEGQHRFTCEPHRGIY